MDIRCDVCDGELGEWCYRLSIYEGDALYACSGACVEKLSEVVGV